MTCRAESHRVIYTFSDNVASGQHIQRFHVPEGYRVVSASFYPDEDETFADISFMGYSVYKVGTATRVDIYFDISASALGGNANVNFQVITECSDEPDLYIKESTDSTTGYWEQF